MEEPEVLPEFPTAGRPRKYDWDSWLDGQVRKLIQGKHYETSTASIRATASNAAKKAGKKLRSKSMTEDDGTEALIIQAYE